jgi:predicted flap endonuclease-1-like 5' DNA nuclease
MLLFDFCSVHPLLPWFLPFLLGLGLGWLLWSKYKGMVSHLEKSIIDIEANRDHIMLECDALRKSKSILDGDVASLKGRMREMESAQSAISVGNSSQLLSTDKEPKIILKDSQSITSEPKSIDIASKDDNNTSKSIKKDNQSISDSTIPIISNDQLQILEGIGPKVEEILHNKGIKSFDQLARKSSSDIRIVLDEFGTKYRMLDPQPWIDQAVLAEKGDWDNLVIKQRELYKSKNPDTSNIVETKLEKHFIKIGLIKRWNQDDLKAVEGIGPKIEQLLHADGINTWQVLANTNITYLQNILDKAGSRYMLADPATWPQQAALAHASDWNTLQKLQGELKAGKKKS